jgi:hypothetical protein
MVKSIILTDSFTLKRHLKSALSQHDLDIENEPLLSDLVVIKDNIRKIGNTSEIRIALGNFIKTNGMPPLIIMDYMVDLGLSREADPDHRKLLRTFFISYVILLQGKGYYRKKNTLILVGDETQERQLGILCKQPHHFFNMMTTENPKINQWLKSFASNPALTNEFFHIDYLVKPKEGVIQGQIHKIHDIVTNVKRRLKMELSQHEIEREIKVEETAPSPPQPLSLLYLFGNGDFYNNGTFEKYDKNIHGEILEDSLFFKGDWISLNQKDGYDLILETLIKRIVPKLSEINQNESNKNFIPKINITLSDQCRIEPGTVPALISLIERELKKIGTVAINISARNKKAIMNTAGFKLLDNYIMQDI